MRRHAGRVGGHGLFHEHVLAGLHRGLELRGPEAGRRAQQHQVHAAVDRLLVGVQPDELPLLGHVDAILLPRGEVLHGGCDAVLEGVGHGHQFHVGLRAEDVHRGAGAAAAGADQGHAQQVAAGGMGAAGHAQLAAAAATPASAERLRKSRREAVRNGIVLGRVGFVSLMEGTFPVRWGS